MAGARQRAGIGEAPPDDELQEQHEAAPAPVPTDGFELERLVFIELERQARAKSKREATVEALKLRDRGVLSVPVLRPSEIAKEAAMQGARGPQALAWIAAAKAVLATGAASVAIPRIVRMAKGVTGTAGVGFRINDAQRIKTLLQGGLVRKLLQGGSGLVGHDFSGTEG